MGKVAAETAHSFVDTDAVVVEHHKDVGLGDTRVVEGFEGLSAERQAALVDGVTFAVRKLAHFGEFLVLGFWFTLCLRVYTRHYIRHISWPLLLGLLIADADELIQLYVAGRDSSVRDVWIDFGGVCTGVGCTLILLLLFGAIWYLLGFGRHKQMA